MKSDDQAAGDPTRLLPLSPHDLAVLLVLSEAPLHGYGIVKASQESKGPVTLELGSLYRIIGRMMRTGLIEEARAELTEASRKRRYYGLTPLGHAVARAEVRRLRALLEANPAMRYLEES